MLLHCDINCQSQFLHTTIKISMNVGYAMSWSFLGLESRCLVNVNITDYDLNRMIYTSKSCSIVESYLKKE